MQDIPWSKGKMRKRIFGVETLILSVCLLILSAATALAEQADAISSATAVEEPCVADFDCNGIVGLYDLFIFLGEFGRNPNNRPCRPCISAPVPKTGQTTSVVIGDDGNLKFGVTWSDPRFTENYTCGWEEDAVPDGTFTDKLTGLIWTKDAQTILGPMSWFDAITACNNLIYPEIPDEEYEDWRLPNIRELQSLIDYGQNNPALPSGHPFDNIQSSYYWSSTAYMDGTDKAWVVNPKDGSISLANKTTDTFYVWPVRGGQ